MANALFTTGAVEVGASAYYTNEALEWADPTNLDRERAVVGNEGWYWDGTADGTGRLWGGCVESLVTQVAAIHGIDLPGAKKPKGETGFVLLPKRWVAERRFAWLSRFRRLARDYERLSSTLQQLYFVVFACLMLARQANSA